MAINEILDPKIRAAISAEFRALVGGKVEVSSEVAVSSNKYPQLPLGGAVEKLELIEEFSPDDAAKLSASYEQVIPEQVRLEVHNPRSFWGVCSRYEPSNRTTRLHTVYSEDMPADYQGYSRLWEELNVDLGTDGIVTDISSSATVTKGFGREQVEDDVVNVRSFRWDKWTNGEQALIVKENSALRIMMTQLQLPMAFIEGLDAGFEEDVNSALDVHNRIKICLREGFKKINS